jgi:basic membrane lipoprotein Med (substrate-binding protein (PBP1-ABC) superfamily)
MGNQETEIHYLKIQRKAKSRVAEKLAYGEIAYLQSLDGILNRQDIETEIYQGVFEIPLDKIKGTYTTSRSKAFTNDFLPLLDIDSEFGQKWTSLYESHLNEGIRDPIKVYEYLNWYYVIEGNKRVSVLKSIDAYSIYASVTRLVPKFDINNPLIVNYYHYLDFNKLTGLRSLWFTKDTGYSELLSLLESYDPKLNIYPNKFKHFEFYVYNPFKDAYKKFGGDKLSITTSDALLIYLKLYGIPQEFILESSNSFMEVFISELNSLYYSENKFVYSDPITEPKKSVFSSLTNFMTSKKKHRIGFLYKDRIDNSGWTYAHDAARRYVSEVYKDTIETTYIENVPLSPSAFNYIENLVNDNYDIIITTHPGFKNATLKAALEFPNVKFLNCSDSPSFKHVIMYYARLYEAKFLLGLLAGILSESNIIGFVADYPIRETITEINAFTLGVQLLNPTAKVIVKWTLQDKTLEKKEKLREQLKVAGADFVFYNTLPVSNAENIQFGLCSINYSKKRKESHAFSHYANMIINWEIFYDKFLKVLLSSSSNNIFDAFSKDTGIVNYWLGIDSGIVDLVYSSKYVPERTKVFLEFFRKTLIKKDFHAFTGPIYNQDGELKIAPDETPTYEQFQSMNWFVKGIEGFIPDLKDSYITQLEL